jgi:AraC-like DNA-binding protein
MPRIIRQALYRKLRELPEMREFQRDFNLLTGFELAFLDELGFGDELDTSSSPLCSAIRANPSGLAMCARTRQALLVEASSRPACAMCDAGLNEVAVPLHIGGIRAGYFLFGGTRPAASGEHGLAKTRHLMAKHGIPMDDESLAAWFRATREADADTMAACQRLVVLFARQIALKLTDHLATPEAIMPPAVTKACRIIRARAFVADIQLDEVARQCGVSGGHLSRLFHHSTGLTFREYLSQVRVEHAKSLLLGTAKNVSEIAYESGFQSLSQFHRSFAKAFGTSPGKMRAGRGAGVMPARRNGRARARG